jgi:hypothetical protein
MCCVQAWSAHGDLCWRNFVSFFLWQARVGREIERYKRERVEERSRGGLEELLV